MLAKCEFVPKARSVPGLLVSAALLLAMASAGESRALGYNPASAQPEPSLPLSVSYKLDIPGGGEIFPALASSAPAEYWPVATLTMVNTSSQPLVDTVLAEIPDWSRQSAQTVNLAPHETRTLQLNPELLPQAFENGEIRPATLEVRASILGTALAYDETRPVYLHSASDFFWGDKFANAQFIARWVTPHDPAVLQLVSLARNYMPRGRLAGYKLHDNAAPAVAAQVGDEARAVFEAMKHLGVSYVDSISTFGNFASKTERVRLPRETLAMNGANCIDMSVAFASAMENLGMEPVIVLVPGHAFTGVRLAHGSSQILFLDLTVMPDGTFDAAVQRAQNWLQKTPKAQVNLIDIATARSRQIYPMPQNVAPTVAQKE
ncbi:MAG: hypothetical protein ABSG32_32255 [Terriglobia bacterium]